MLLIFLLLHIIVNLILDTLGVCVFLALAKYKKDDNTVVLLDDVVTSVDQVSVEQMSSEC